jgi:ATP-dependent Lon protease
MCLCRFPDAGKAAAYTAREKRPNNNNNKMDMTRDQREGFMRLLQEAKAKKNAEYQREVDKKVKEEVLPKIMQRQGIVRLVEQVKQIGSQLSESAQKLQGMDVFGQPATLWGKILGTNEGVEELVEKMKRPYTEHAESSLRDYDHAILQVLSATNLEDVQRIVSNLI